MRKWMSERLKRRKKTADGSSKEGTKAPEPLQPKFYDNEPATPEETPAEAPVVETRQPSPPEPVAEAEPAAEPASEQGAESATAGGRPRPTRRRRGRGGRGGSRSRPLAAPPAVAAEAVAEPSAAVTSTGESSIAEQYPGFVVSAFGPFTPLAILMIA